jgi:hypothetical protein
LERQKMIKFSYEMNTSIFLDVNGIEFYVGDDEKPTQIIPLEELVDEFLDSRSLCDDGYDDIDGLEKVRDMFKIAMKKLNSAIENGV